MGLRGGEPGAGNGCVSAGASVASSTSMAAHKLRQGFTIAVSIMKQSLHPEARAPEEAREW